MFETSQFTPTEWDSVEDKLKFANQFVKFFRSGFKKSRFPKWFYKKLSNTFGHIAHYDQLGFFNHFFTTKHGVQEFLNQTLSYGCYGSPEYTYCDVEKAIQEWLRKEIA